jgi:hypothetical protein
MLFPKIKEKRYIPLTFNQNHRDLCIFSMTLRAFIIYFTIFPWCLSSFFGHFIHKSKASPTLRYQFLEIT